MSAAAAPAAPPPGANRIRLGNRVYALMLGAPALVGLLLFLVVPFLMAFGLTFTDQKLLSPNETEFVGLRNYSRLLSVTVLMQEATAQPDGTRRFERVRNVTRTTQEYRGYRPFTQVTLGTHRYVVLAKDPVFIRSLLNTVLFVVLVVPLQTAAALGMALLVNLPLKGRTIFRTIYFAPVVMSMVVVSVVWAFLYDTELGLINRFLSAASFGAIGPIDWLGNASTAMPAIVLMSAWQGAGFQMLIFLAGLQNIPEELYEAARVDGANAFQRFRHITLPGLRNTMVFVVIATTVAAFGLFAQVDVMTQGGPGDATSTVIFHAVRKGVREQDIAYGATISVIYFLVIAVIAISQKRIFERGDR